MKTILLILATLISFTAFGKDEAQTTTRYRYNSVITIDPTVQIMAEDGSWTNTAKTLGYLSLVTSDIQTQLNSKTNSVISGAALNLTNTANVFVGKGTGLTNVTAVGVTGYSLKTNNLVAVALVEQTNALGYVTNTYLTYTTNAINYLGQ